VESEHNEVDGMKKGVDSKGEVMQYRVLSALSVFLEFLDDPLEVDP